MTLAIWHIIYLVYTSINDHELVDIETCTQRESVLDHNHRIGPDVSALYPSNRKLTEEENAAINEVLSL